MFEYYFFDLDGTLMHFGSKIYPEVWKALELLKNNNKNILISTGRDLLGIRPLMKKIGARYYILNNGALIYDYKKKIKIFENFLDNNKLKKYSNYFFNNKYKVGFYSNNGVYMNKRSFFLSILFKLHFYKLKYVRDWNGVKDLKLYKLIIIESKFNKKKYDNLINLLKNDFNLVKVPWGYNVNSKNTTKGFATHYLNNILNGDFKNSACHIGDGYNDISTKKYVKKLVAMSNARDSLKKEADIVLDGNRRTQILRFVNDAINKSD